MYLTRNRRRVITSIKEPAEKQKEKLVNEEIKEKKKK
jgi:hypothetical protein